MVGRPVACHHMTQPRRELDLVLYGASGFTGRLVAEYLARTAPAGTAIGLAGRSVDKVNAVRDALGEGASSWTVLPADSGDQASLDSMAQRARAVVTTVGPYSRYGLPVVEACATAGTHYADLAGEVLFMRDSIDRYDGTARKSGARIVHSCGFDSIPSDLGVLELAQAVAAAGAGLLGPTTLAVTGMRGGASGGTIASFTAETAAMRADPARRATVRDPYGLSPDRAAEPDLGDESDVATSFFDDQLEQWVAPFAMAFINTRTVRRTNALLGYPYGRTFRYREVMAYGAGPEAATKATAMATAVRGGTALLGNRITGGVASAVADRVVPAPGEGPDEQTRRRGYFQMEIHTETTTGARFVEYVAGQGDPGYAATSVMLGQAGLSLALDGDSLPAVSGVLTPAATFGSLLVDRLRAAGMTFDAVPLET